MATGRTISASFLTDLDTKVIELCNSISLLVQDLIADNELKKDFKEQYGKISYIRDSGLGLGGGKLKRCNFNKGATRKSTVFKQEFTLASFNCC